MSRHGHRGAFGSGPSPYSSQDARSDGISPFRTSNAYPHHGLSRENAAPTQTPSHGQGSLHSRPLSPVKNMPAVAEALMRQRIEREIREKVEAEMKAKIEAEVIERLMREMSSSSDRGAATTDLSDAGLSTPTTKPTSNTPLPQPVLGPGPSASHMAASTSALASTGPATGTHSATSSTSDAPVGLRRGRGIAKRSLIAIKDDAPSEDKDMQGSSMPVAEKPSAKPSTMEASGNVSQKQPSNGIGSFTTASIAPTKALDIRDVAKSHVETHTKGHDVAPAPTPTPVAAPAPSSTPHIKVNRVRFKLPAEELDRDNEVVPSSSETPPLPSAARVPEARVDRADKSTVSSLVQTLMDTESQNADQLQDLTRRMASLTLRDMPVPREGQSSTSQEPPIPFNINEAMRKERVVYIVDVPPSATEEDIEDFCKGYQIDFVSSPRIIQSRKVFTVAFSTANIAKHAASMLNRRPIFGWPVSVLLAKAPATPAEGSRSDAIASHAHEEVSGPAHSSSATVRDTSPIEVPWPSGGVALSAATRPEEDWTPPAAAEQWATAKLGFTHEEPVNWSPLSETTPNPEQTAGEPANEESLHAQPMLEEEAKDEDATSDDSDAPQTPGRLTPVEWESVTNPAPDNHEKFDQFKEVIWDQPGTTQTKLPGLDVYGSSPPPAKEPAFAEDDETTEPSPEDDGKTALEAAREFMAGASRNYKGKGRGKAPASNRPPAKPVCKYHLAGFCRAGLNCQFEHPRSQVFTPPRPQRSGSHPPNKGQTEIPGSSSNSCRDLEEWGWCSTRNCKYDHPYSRRDKRGTFTSTLKLPETSVPDGRDSIIGRSVYAPGARKSE